MPLDLTKLAKPKKAIVPILNGSFRFNKKAYRIDADDGWGLVEIEGNISQLVSVAHPTEAMDQKFEYVAGYTHNNSILFQNFDTARRKWDKGFTAPLEFNTSPTFEPIRVIAWEDGNFYWVEPNYQDISHIDIKNAYEQEQSLQGVKGVTPELRTLYLFHALERDQLKKVLIEKVAKEEHERRMKDIPYRLNKIFENAGATLLNYSLSGKRIIVDWEIMGQKHRYNSVIDAATFKIIEAGYCMSGDDKRHNVTSLVKTAEEYAERNLTYITRRD